jgi:para-aminobenzoate synthetase/4-amino-4-deoxychorismate lyase
MASLSAPFVLLDDARPGGRTTLFSGLQEAIETRDFPDVRRCLQRLRGRSAAGFLTYEAGHALEEKLAPLRRGPSSDSLPLLWFGLFEREEEIDFASFLPNGAGAWSGPARPLISYAEYQTALAAAKTHIEAGDIYQANLTFAAEVPFAGHPLALYAALRERAKAGYGAVVFTGLHWILSLSPELFFTLDDGRLTAKPMKGTAPRGADVEAFRADPKQRAENLMIVDLLRNDLSRVARPGTVGVPKLFEVETYPTILQMTSTVTAELAEGLGPIDVIETIFPCGSITGAPKIRAMEVIDALEAAPRSVYCGAIGRMGAEGSAAFNVAIRTLVLKDGERVARLGLGSGIVADSAPLDEWNECLAKGRFVATARNFDLIETMRFDPHDGIAHLDRHLARMRTSAVALDFRFDRHEARNDLQAASFRAGPSRIRLALSRGGALSIELSPLGDTPAEPVDVAFVPRPVPADDFRLSHKTSDRAFYDGARTAAGAFEVIFTDSEGFLTEGSFTSLFVERDGVLLTPPLARGLLPGVLRGALIDEGKAREADLTLADLADGFLIGNALRGLVRAQLRSPTSEAQT